MSIYFNALSIISIIREQIKIKMNGNMQRRPQFQHYPLNTQQLSDLHQERQVVEKDIVENLAEIRMLNNKMAKNDYEITYLHRLKERERMLNDKKREMDDILRTHQYLQEEVNAKNRNEQQFRSTLANEYKTVMEQKKRKESEAKRRQIEEEQAMLQHNQRMYEADMERKRWEFQQTKRAVQEELAMKEAMKQKQRDQKEREKEEFNKKVQMRNNLESQKQAVYKQYYQQFMDNQNRLQNVYEDQTAPKNQQREQGMQQFLRKQQEEFAKQQAHQQEERMRRAINDKEALRDYLKYQMEEKERRRSMENQQRRSYNEQVAAHTMSNKQYEQMEKQRRKEQQRRYDEDLAGQIKMRSTMTKDSPSSPSHRLYNPITNPIDFKMGITNPYVIKEYEQSKERYVGDRDLKLKHLAMVGNKSLVHS